MNFCPPPSAFRPPASLRARADQHNRNRAPENFDVEPERPVVDVLEIEADPILEILHVVPSAYLPETGQARPHAQATAMREVVEAFHFVNRQRPRTNEAHLAAKHVEELREFIDAELAQNFPEGRDPGILGHLE